MKYTRQDQVDCDDIRSSSSSNSSSSRSSSWCLILQLYVSNPPIEVGIQIVGICGVM